MIFRNTCFTRLDGVVGSVMLEPRHMKLDDLLVAVLGAAGVLFGIYAVSLTFQPMTDPPPDAGKTAIVLLVGVGSILLGAVLLWFSFPRKK